MSQLEVDKIIPQSGTTLTIGDSGDTITFGTGTTPQLGGNLDLNSNDITGTGNINITGTATVSGDLTVGDGHTIGNDAFDNLRLQSSSTENIKFDFSGEALLIFNSGSEVARFTNAGNLGIGTSSPSRLLHLNTTGSGTNTYLQLTSNATGTGTLDGFQIIVPGNDASTILAQRENASLQFWTNNTERMRIDSSGNVGVGTSSPQYLIESVGTNAGGEVTGLAVRNNATTAGGSASIYFVNSTDPTSASNRTKISSIRNASSDHDLAFYTNSGSVSERMRIDSSGNVGIGTSSPNVKLEIYDADPYIRLTDSVAPTGYSQVMGTFQGGLVLSADTSNSVADSLVRFDVDGTERMRIDSSGRLLVGTTTITPSTSNVNGFAVSDSQVNASRGGTVAEFNRISTDGALVSLRQDGTSEGTISVSGTTVSYNGGHLARWSQLTTNTRDESILKGTVMSNLDEMCVWGDEDNEQLNKMKVSDTEGDDNVAGVFVNWDNDDDVYTNDMNIAMTGDMVIRIAQGVTVTKGQLLISAGDGTAKPQGDDIVRSKTIAKVTSNNVTKTYDDGSYLVPCVLMAC